MGAYARRRPGAFPEEIPPDSCVMDRARPADTDVQELSVVTASSHQVNRVEAFSVDIGMLLFTPTETFHRGDPWNCSVHCSDDAIDASVYEESGHYLLKDDWRVKLNVMYAQLRRQAYDIVYTLERSDQPYSKQHRYLVKAQCNPSGIRREAFGTPIFSLPCL